MRVAQALRLLAGTVLLALGVSLMASIIGITSGPGALAAILQPHLTVLAVLASPAFFSRERPLIAAIAGLLLVVAVAQLGPEVYSFPASPQSNRQLRVATWNLLSGGTSPEEAVAKLLEVQADVIALQELTSQVANAIADSAEVGRRFPYRVLAPEATVLGMGLLSRYPLQDERSTTDPPAILARHDGPDGRSIALLNAHPLPGRITMGGGIPVAFDGRQRDEDIATLRRIADEYRRAGEPLLLLGDYNVVRTEPGYRALVDGLRDAHAEAGSGTGWTWRPSRLGGAPFALLRIDYVLTSPELQPFATSVDCGVPGDHCILEAHVAVER